TAVRSLIRTDVDAADRVLARVGDMVRASIVRGRTTETTLREEIQSLEPLLDIERARLGGRLAVDVDVADDVMDALVPDVLLEPLIRRAAKLAMDDDGGGARILIAAAPAGERREWVTIS